MQYLNKSFSVPVGKPDVLCDACCFGEKRYQHAPDCQKGPCRECGVYHPPEWDHSFPGLIAKHLGIKPEDVTPEMIRDIKAVTFGLRFGK